MRENVVRTKGLLTVLVMMAGALLLPRLSSAGVEARLSDDAYTSSTASGNNFGGSSTLNIKDPTLKSFLKFDLSTLPSGTLATDVKKATLKFFVDQVTTIGSFEVRRVTGTWTEAGITNNNAPGSVPLSPVVTVTLTTADLNDYKEIEITGLVKAWLDTPSTTPNSVLPSFLYLDLASLPRLMLRRTRVPAITLYWKSSWAQ